jgi:hypothetical protein
MISDYFKETVFVKQTDAAVQLAETRRNHCFVLEPDAASETYLHTWPTSSREQADPENKLRQERVLLRTVDDVPIVVTREPSSAGSTTG